MLVFDALLALILIALALGIVAVHDLHRSIVLFVVLGLLLALSWVRLEAPDLALAEAAIGAGLLGVLLLATWRATRARAVERFALGRGVRIAAALGSTAFAVGFGGALHALLEQGPASGATAGALALERLGEAGTPQPVTAVLLNFRSYDTLLELAVLLMALIGALLLRAPLFYPTPATAAEHDDRGIDAPLMPALVTVFTPLILLTGAYLVWAGAYVPGGAFQGGAVLAGAGVMLVLGGRLRAEDHATLFLRLVLVLGVAVFTLIGLLLLAWSGAFMAYPEGWVTPLMVTIEFSLAASIAVSLLLLFTGTHGVGRAAP